MNIVITILSILLLFLSIFSTVTLGNIRVFLSIDELFSSPVPKYLMFVIAWLLFATWILSPISMIIGTIEIFHQCKRYRARKYMTAEQIAASGNMSLWAEARKNDRIKLIYAYSITMFCVILEMAGWLNTELYSRYGYGIRSIPHSTVTYLGMYVYFILILPPTFMRFVAFQRKLKYGLEVSFCFAMSFLISLSVNFLITREILVSFGLTGVLAVYCVLSYKSSEYSEEWHSFTFNPTAFALIILALIALISGVITNGKQWYLPICEAIIACCVLTRHKDKATQSEPEQLQENTQEPPCQDGGQEPINLSRKLIDIGLAHIGRKTSLSNKYLTPEQTEARKSIERPFLKILAEKFRDEAARKKLARHFMLYKETTLFMIYAIVLKNNKELHSQVRSGLKEILSLNISSEVQDKRGNYWQAISRKFYDEYKRTGENVKTALNFSFWSKLLDEVPEILAGESYTDMRTEDGLYAVFMYSYGAISCEYKALINS